MLLFAPTFVLCREAVPQGGAAHEPRHLQLLAALRASSFAENQLQRWLPGAYLPGSQRVAATLHVIQACMPQAALHIMAALRSVCDDGSPSAEPLGLYQPTAVALRTHTQARVRAQQTITPQLPLQHLARYLEHHLAYCEGRFGLLLHQHWQLQSMHLPDRLAGAALLLRHAAQGPVASPAQARQLQRQAAAALAHHAQALHTLPASALMRWQTVLAECAVVLADSHRQPHGLDAPALARALLARWKLPAATPEPTDAAVAA